MALHLEQTTCTWWSWRRASCRRCCEMGKHARPVHLTDIEGAIMDDGSKAGVTSNQSMLYVRDKSDYLKAMLGGTADWWPGFHHSDPDLHNLKLFLTRAVSTSRE